MCQENKLAKIWCQILMSRHLRNLTTVAQILGIFDPTALFAGNRWEEGNTRAAVIEESKDTTTQWPAAKIRCMREHPILSFDVIRFAF